MFDPAGQGAFGLYYAYQSQAQGRAFEGQLGDVYQRLRILPGLVSHRHEDHFVDRLLARSADHGVGQPEQGIVEVEDLQEGLSKIHP